MNFSGFVFAFLYDFVARQKCMPDYLAMAKLITYIFLIACIIIWYFFLSNDNKNDRTRDEAKGKKSHQKQTVFVAATNGHGSPLEGRDRHHHERGGHIRRDINHCWRRYDGYNLQNTIVNKKEQLKKPYGILCNFKCTWFFTINFPTCEFIYDYKLSCYLFTSLPDCTTVKCTLLNFFT